MDAAFAAILHRDPRARLVIFRGTDDHATERLLERWRDALDAGMDRFVVLPRMRLNGFLNVLALADVVLDTWPFGGGNTSYQSFAMGVPVVTLPGRFMRGRTSLVHYRHMRSEEHTSELQSLMRISYAVFCLKKKKHNSQ